MSYAVEFAVIFPKVNTLEYEVVQLMVSAMHIRILTLLAYIASG